MSDDELSQLRMLAKQALTFQNFVIRRAWGVHYAVWALVVSVWVFLPRIMYYVAPQLPWTAYFIFYSLVGVAAGFATSSIFGRAHRTVVLRSAFGNPAMSRSQLVIFAS
ncbi:MAG: hypothetical protein QXV32_00945 [Conexivisphaerales archaeon]